MGKQAATTFVRGAIAPSQIKAIHAVIHKLGMDDEAYRDVLKTRYSARSCKDLTWKQAEELLDNIIGLLYAKDLRKDLTWKQAEELLEDLNGSGRQHGSANTRRGGAVRALKYQDMDGRPGFASGAQLRKISAMWASVSRAEGEDAIEKALNSFCYSRVGVAGIRMLKGDQAHKIIAAIDAMVAAKAAKEAVG